MFAESDFLRLVEARQSDRAYDVSRPVEQEKLERILQAARLLSSLPIPNWPQQSERLPPDWA